MRSTHLAVFVAALSLAASFSSAATVTYSASAPVVDGGDVASVTGTTTDGGNVSGGDDAFTYIAMDRATAVGQTFTTGSSVGGYTLDAVSLQHATYNHFFDTDDVNANNVYTVRIGTITGGVFTAIATETAANTPPGFGQGYPANGTGNYLTLALSSGVTLAPNTQYAFDVRTASNGYLFFETNGTSTDAYSGGGAFNSNGSATTLGTGDHVFHANLTAIPEPATLTAGLAAMGLLVRRRRSR